jgi:hypothetical protein
MLYLKGDSLYKKENLHGNVILYSPYVIKVADEKPDF